VAAQQDAEVVEPADDPLQLHPVDQEDGQRRLGFADAVEEGVLQILLFFAHRLFALFLSRGPRRSPTHASWKLVPARGRTQSPAIKRPCASPARYRGVLAGSPLVRRGRPPPNRRPPSRPAGAARPPR